MHLLIKLSENDSQSPLPQPVLTLSEACIHAARHSHSLILTKYFNGTLPVFGYFHAHYLFSSALALAMSSFVPVGSPSDMGGFETALEVLRSMSENGNLAAADFWQNLEQVNFCLEGYWGERERRRRGGGRGMGNVNAMAAIGPGDVSAASVQSPGSIGTGNSTAMGQETVVGTMQCGGNNPGTMVTSYPPIQSNRIPVHDASGGFTTAMAFLEPTMQDFLAQSDFDLGLLNPVDKFLNDAESLYTCHGL